jgi:hypothetical protein
MGGVFNTVNLHLYHYAGNNPVKYVDPDGRSSDIEEMARSLLYKAVAFIQKEATTDEEKSVATILTEMMNNKKVQLDNIKGREGREAYGFFDDRRNTKTGEPRNIIVVDITMAIEGGLVELIDTLSHEGYHAVQNASGINISDMFNKSGVTWGELVDVEHPAWNMGLQMSNKYRQQNNINIGRTNFSDYEVYQIIKESRERDKR